MRALKSTHRTEAYAGCSDGAKTSHTPLCVPNYQRARLIWVTIQTIHVSLTNSFLHILSSKLRKFLISYNRRLFDISLSNIQGIHVGQRIPRVAHLCNVNLWLHVQGKPLLRRCL